MKIAVISDSHGNIKYLEEFKNKLKLLGGVDLIIHLGDDSPDSSVFKGFKVISVPGAYENHYSTPGNRKRLIEEFEGHRILITHTPVRHENDLPHDPSPEELGENMDAVLYGHTHVPDIELKKSSDGNEVLWINPGHMKKDDRRGFKASYAVLDLTDKINVKIFDFLSGKVIKEYP